MSTPRKLLSTISPTTLGLTTLLSISAISIFSSSSSSSNNNGSARNCPAQNNFKNNSAFSQNSPFFRDSSSSLQSGEPVLPQKALGSKPVFPGGSSGFVELVLEEARMVNGDTRELKFRVKDGGKDVVGEKGRISGLGTISSLLTRHTKPTAWIPTFRPYTPISTPQDPHITLLVKHYPSGAASSHLHSLLPGETLLAKPLAEYTYTRNQHKEIVMVAGGAGITPMLQLLRTALADAADDTKLKLVYAARTQRDLLLKEELDGLAKRFPERFGVRYFVGEGEGEEEGVERGVVTKEVLRGTLGDRRREGVKVLVCGPPGLVEAVAGRKGMRGWSQGKVGGALKELGFAEGDVYKF